MERENVYKVLEAGEPEKNEKNGETCRKEKKEKMGRHDWVIVIVHAYGGPWGLLFIFKTSNKSGFMSVKENSSG